MVVVYISLRLGFNHTHALLLTGDDRTLSGAVMMAGQEKRQARQERVEANQEWVETKFDTSVNVIQEEMEAEIT
jgi:hypothetical protein